MSVDQNHPPTQDPREPPALAVSFFNEKTDARPKVRQLPWRELAHRLTTHAERGEKDGPLWSPASYDVGRDTRRKSEQVRAISCAVFDFDHGAPPREHLAALGVAHLLYTTHSHLRVCKDNKEGAPRWRVVVPFARPVPLKGTDWRHLWLRLYGHLAPGATADEDCKDSSRMYYLPACRAGAPRHAEIVEGPFLDPDTVPPLSPEAEAAASRPAPPVGERVVHPHRHAVIKSLAGSMRRRGMSEREMAAALLVVNADRCDPPIPEEDILRIARNYAEYPPGDPVSGVTGATATEVPPGTPPQEAVPPVTPVPGSSEGETGDALLDAVLAFLCRYVAFPSPEAAVATALWAAHTHAVDAFESTPRLALLSPEKQSGKTRTLEALELLSPGARHAASLSAAALFRLVADTTGDGKGGPGAPCTLLLDEADTFFGSKAQEHEDLRGLINAGHRKGAVAYRCVGDPHNIVVKEFPAFCPVALAGIGGLPDTIIDRAVVIKMRRRSPTEQVTPFRHREAAADGGKLRGRLAAWTRAHRKPLEDARPAMPPGITDRPADVWEPLLALADLAGGAWPERARLACARLNKEREAADSSMGARLLADVRAVFAGSADGRLTSATLVEELVRIEESPWGSLPRSGKPIDAIGLARRLKPYDVAPKMLRFGEKSARGYEVGWFEDAFARYLPAPDPPEKPVTPVTGETPRSEPVTGSEGRYGSTRYTAPTRNTVPQEGVTGVTPVTGFSGGETNGRHHGGLPPRTRVVHLRRGEPHDVDVSRAGPWGNPFGRPGRGATVTVADDAEAVACFRAWLGGDPRWDDRIDPARGAYILNNVAQLAGKTLGCYCAPAGGVDAADLPHVCHGQVLAELADFHAARAAQEAA